MFSTANASAHIDSTSSRTAATRGGSAGSFRTSWSRRETFSASARLVLTRSLTALITDFRCAPLASATRFRIACRPALPVDPQARERVLGQVVLPGARVPAVQGVVDQHLRLVGPRPQHPAEPLEDRDLAERAPRQEPGVDLWDVHPLAEPRRRDQHAAPSE